MSRACDSNHPHLVLLPILHIPSRPPGSGNRPRAASELQADPPGPTGEEGKHPRPPALTKSQADVGSQRNHLKLAKALLGASPSVSSCPFPSTESSCERGSQFLAPPSWRLSASPVLVLRLPGSPSASLRLSFVLFAACSPSLCLAQLPGACRSCRTATRGSSCTNSGSSATRPGSSSTLRSGRSLPRLQRPSEAFQRSTRCCQAPRHGREGEAGRRSGETATNSQAKKGLGAYYPRSLQNRSWQATYWSSGQSPSPLGSLRHPHSSSLISLTSLETREAGGSPAPPPPPTLRLASEIESEAHQAIPQAGEG